jgi:hypothetical protein
MLTSAFFVTLLLGAVTAAPGKLFSSISLIKEIF